MKIKITAVCTVLAIFAYGALPANAEEAVAPSCQEAESGLWVCPLPVQPVAPRCVVFGKKLICSAPVTVAPPQDMTKPSNCGWSRKHGYVCW